jgi:hypothetical protein
MKFILIGALASACMFAGASTASALCLQKPSEAKLKSTAVEELRKVSRAAANLYAEDVVVLEKKCDGLTGRGNTWKVSTPVGKAACTADDQMRGASCSFEREGDNGATKAGPRPAAEK